MNGENIWLFGYTCMMNTISMWWMMKAIHPFLEEKDVRIDFSLFMYLLEYFP